MSEYWLISAPGDKTCQQTFDTLNNLTSHEHNLSINYKFPIPDLKVGTLDQLVGLSDDLGKLDTYVEQITRKVASYLGEVLEDQRDKLHENLLANNYKSCHVRLYNIDEDATNKDNECIIGNVTAALNDAISNDNNKNFKISDECIHDASDEIMAVQTQNDYLIIAPYNCNRNCHAMIKQCSSLVNHSMAPKKFFFKYFLGNNNNNNNNSNNICKINQNIQNTTTITPATAIPRTFNNTVYNSDNLNNPTQSSVEKSSFKYHYHDQQKQQQHQHHHHHHQQQQQQQPNQSLKYINKILNPYNNIQHCVRTNETQQSVQQLHQQSKINKMDRVRISGANPNPNAIHQKTKAISCKSYEQVYQVKQHTNCNCNCNGKVNDENDEIDLNHTIEWWCQYTHRNDKFMNFHAKQTIRRQRSLECCYSCRANNSHNSSPDHDICEVLGSPKSPHPADLSAYITRFQWDMAKYPIKQSLRNIADIISKQVGQIDADLKTKATAYNNLKGNLQNLEKKQTGSLLTRNLADLVKKEHFILDSEYLTTLLVIVPKILSNEWIANYEKITDMIVPRSSILINQDNDYCLFNVTLFKKVVDEFKLHAREKKFIVRDFEYNEEEMAAGKNEITKLITDKKKQFGPLVRWLKVNFSEAFCALIHVKALRVFVESVLRYGLPVNFQAILIQPHKKCIKRLRECLNQLYGHLDGSSAGAQASGLENVDIPGLGFGQAEYYPYVFYKINIDMIDTRA